MKLFTYPCAQSNGHMNHFFESIKNAIGKPKNIHPDFDFEVLLFSPENISYTAYYIPELASTLPST